MKDSRGRADGQDEGQSQPIFDPDEAARMLGLTGKQKKLADNLISGMTQQQAAIAAGYAPKHASSGGNKAANSAPVKAYIAWAQKGGHGVPDDAVDDAELRRILAKHVRGSGPHTMKAAELIARMNRLEKETEAAQPLDPIAILARMLVVAARSDEAAATAFVRALADSHGLCWADVQARVPKSEMSATPNALTAADRARAAHVERLNTQSLDRAGNGLPRSSEAPVVPFSAPTGGAAAESPAAPPIDNPHGTGRMQIFGE